MTPPYAAFIPVPYSARLDGLAVTASRFIAVLASLSCLCLPASAPAQDKPGPTPQITAIVPLVVPPGFNGAIKLRGFHLKGATEVRTDATTKPSKLTVKDPKNSDAPSKMEKDVVGDSEVTLELTLPDDFPAGALPLTVVAGDRSATPVALVVLPKDQFAEEKEPNNGFRSAMKIELGRAVIGVINNERDVDVFEVTAKAGQRLRATVTARTTASLLDPLLSVFDARGNPIATRDDIDLKSADAIIDFVPTADGPIFIVLQDALDFGSGWHAYRLDVAPTPDTTPATKTP